MDGAIVLSGDIKKISYAKRRKIFPQMEMIYKPEDLNLEYYEKAKKSEDRELEHQIGRLANFKSILKDCESIPGDIAEFGTYRGFSLLWIAYLLERQGVFSKKIAGLDSFEGLPYDDGSFRKHAFSNTSYVQCKNNIFGSRKLYPITKNNIFIGKYRFNDIEGIRTYLKKWNIGKFCFIHIDCDVSQSFLETMALFRALDLIAPTAYILFDDYGCESNLATTVDRVFSEMQNRWNISVHSSTQFTKNFKLVLK